MYAFRNKKRSVLLSLVALVFLLCLTRLYHSHIYSIIARPLLMAFSPVAHPLPIVRTGRRGNDSRWYLQTTPFELHAYSSFYDDRPLIGSPSVGTFSPRVVVNAVFDSASVVGECLLWFDGREQEVDALHVPAETVAFTGGAHLIVCSLPTNLTEIPVNVALSWRNGTVVGRTRWRIPIEVIRRPTNPDQLVLCLGATYGSPEPLLVAEWLEMQRLIGVDRVIVYNGSMSTDSDRVFNDYSIDGFVELRQSRGDHLLQRTVACRKTIAINDCMYRYMGSYHYIAVMDLDEVIIPRQNFTSLPSLLKNMSSGSQTAMFLFRNAHHFLELPADDGALPLKHGSNASMSNYLTHRRRAAVSPLYYVIKYVIDSNACLGAWIHLCLRFTVEYQTRHTIRTVNVPPDLAMKHHYRKECNFGKIVYGPNACEREIKSSVIDNVLDKYANDLLLRLTKYADRLKLLSKD